MIDRYKAEAYNWGVEYALTAHNRGERIPSPRQYSVPLTRFRHETGSAHSLLLQRGGFWCAVGAVKEWSKRRNQLVYGQREAVEGTDNAFAGLGALLEKLADGSGGSDGSDGAVSVHACALSETLAQYRSAHRCRVKLVECGEKTAVRLWSTPPDAALSAMPADERCERIAEAVEGSDKALESFNAAMRTLRAATNSATITKAARERLRGLADKAHTAAAAEAKAGKRLLAHVARGDERLFRSRHDAERCSGPALVVFDGCTFRDGVLRLPGGTEIPLPAGFATIEDVLAAHRGGGLVWSGAVHVVDVTDKAGRATRRTAPEHRKYHVHFLCRASAAAPLPVASPEHSLGTGWGVAVALVCSDGTAHRRHASPDQQQANRERRTEASGLQQSMAAKTVGSRRHAKQNRRRQRLLAKNTDVRVNHQCHTAKAVVMTAGVRHVVSEDTKVSNLAASAEGTKAFPVRGSAGKRGFDRSLAETAPAR